MALITRVSRLFRADFHEVLDRLEEPGVLLRQAVRDMETELAGEERKHEMLSRDLQRIDARIDELERSLEEIDGELDLCFESGKEDLARPLVKRKLETQGCIQLLRHQCRGRAQDHAALGRRIEDNRSRLENMRQKAEILGDREEAHEREDGRDDPRFETRVAVSDDDVEVAMLRERRRRAGS